MIHKNAADYPARVGSPLDWFSQLDIWFQLVKIWVTSLRSLANAERELRANPLEPLLIFPGGHPAPRRCSSLESLPQKLALRALPRGRRAPGLVQVITVPGHVGEPCEGCCCELEVLQLRSMKPR